MAFLSCSPVILYRCNANSVLSMYSKIECNDRQFHHLMQEDHAAKTFETNQHCAYICIYKAQCPKN